MVTYMYIETPFRIFIAIAYQYIIWLKGACPVILNHGKTHQACSYMHNYDKVTLMCIKQVTCEQNLMSSI